jgi:hypothetical protein
VTSLTIELPDELADRLAELARERGVSPEAVARELLEGQLPPVPDDAPDFIGIRNSGRGDLSERAKELRQAEFGS